MASLGWCILRDWGHWILWFVLLLLLASVLMVVLRRHWEAAAQERLAKLRAHLRKVKVHRVWAVGSSGAGKTFFAQEVAKTLGTECLDLDDYFWGENWRRIPTADVLERLKPQLHTRARWAIAGNYHAEVGVALLPLATVIVWIHPSRWQIMRQLVWRSILRAVGLTAGYCAGNQESPYSVFCTRKSIIYRTWQKIHAVEERYSKILEQKPAGMKGAMIELAGRREVAEFLLHCLRKANGDQDTLALVQRQQQRAKARKLATAVWKASFRHIRRNTTKNAEKQAKKKGVATSKHGMRRSVSGRNLHRAERETTRQRRARRK